MKTIVLFLALLGCNISLSAAENSPPTEAKFICNEKAYFTAPTQSIPVGDDIYVRVKFNDDRFVSSVKLYIGHQPIRLDNSAPYAWGLPNSTNDSQLRNMPAGTYSLTAEVRYSCGNKRTFSKKVTVGSRLYQLQQYNPIYTLVWLNKIHRSQPRSSILEYRKGSTTYYKIKPCSNSGFIMWYDSKGRIRGKYRNGASSQGQFRYARLVKAWVKPCR